MHLPSPGPGHSCFHRNWSGLKQRAQTTVINKTTYTVVVVVWGEIWLKQCGMNKREKMNMWPGVMSEELFLWKSCVRKQLTRQRQQRRTKWQQKTVLQVWKLLRLWNKKVWISMIIYQKKRIGCQNVKPGNINCGKNVKCFNCVKSEVKMFFYRTEVSLRMEFVCLFSLSLSAQTNLHPG